jgi:hypothetical protein
MFVLHPEGYDGPSRGASRNGANGTAVERDEDNGRR